MKQDHPDERDFDTLAGRYLDAFAQRTSRRGLLARFAKALLGLTGLTLVPNLPLYRVVEAQSTPCSDWRLCGIYGNLCKACCGSPESLTTCPGCLSRGSYWAKCCTDANGVCKNISYYDCCGSSSSASACKGTWCARNTPQSVWCGGVSGTYGCTVISIGANC